MQHGVKDIWSAMRMLTAIINQQMEPWYHLKLLMLNELH